MSDSVYNSTSITVPCWFFRSCAYSISWWNSVTMAARTSSRCWNPCWISSMANWTSPSLPTMRKEVGHDDVIKWNHFRRYWPFVRGIHRSPVNSQHKGQWRGALMFSLICVWINGWVNNREADDLRRHRAHYDVTVMNDWYFFYEEELAKPASNLGHG